MELTRLSRNLLYLSVLITAAAIFFNSAIALIAAASILVSLGWRYSIFHRKIRRVLYSCRVERKLEKTIVRQGSIVPVSVRCTFRTCPGPGMQVAVRDLLPPGVTLVSGSSGDAPAGDGDRTLAYSVAFRVHGDSSFPGLSLECGDRYFSDMFLLGTPPFQGPVVAVQPTSEFEPLLGFKGYGEEEIERIRAVSGHGIRGYREFYDGDDMRHIDWKLTAKHGRMMLREYTMLGGSYPLIILDLPSDPGSEGDRAFQVMVGAATGAVERSLKEFRRTSLLLIAGPNVVRAYPEERRFPDAMQIIRRDVHPVPPQRTLYRFKSRQDLEASARTAQREAASGRATDEKAFLAAIADVYQASARTGEIYAFIGEIARMIQSAVHDEVLLFSLCEGDTSHLRILADQAHRRKMKIQLYTPVCPGRPGIEGYKSAYRMDGVEAIPCR